MTFGGGRKRQPWVGWGGQHPPGAQESALGCKNSSSIPRHSLGAFMCPEKMGIVVTLPCGAPVPWAALAPLAHAHDAPSLLCPTAPGTTQHPWPRTSPAPFSPTQPPAPTHSHGTVPIEGGHCGATGPRFHAGPSELPYHHHDLCWSQIRGWSRLDLFDFC